MAGDAITELLDSRETASKLPRALMLIETPVDGNSAKVRDELGRDRYTVIHPHWYDAVTAKFVKAHNTVAEADPEDSADYKSTGAMDKYGFAADGWLVGIKSRTTGTQYLTRPYAVTRYSGMHSNANITAGIFDYAKKPKKLDLKDGKKAEWSKVFADVDIAAEVSDGGGLTMRHRWHADACTDAEWYGTIWEVDCTAAEFLALIQRDGEHDTRLQPYVTGDGKQCIIEYFPREQFDGGDVVHDYTTISANLSEDRTLTAGTYSLTVRCELGNYNLIFDNSGVQ